MGLIWSLRTQNFRRWIHYYEEGLRTLQDIKSFAKSEYKRLQKCVGGISTCSQAFTLSEKAWKAGCSSKIMFHWFHCQMETKQVLIEMLEFSFWLATRCARRGCLIPSIRRAFIFNALNIDICMYFFVIWTEYYLNYNSSLVFSFKAFHISRH